MIGGWNVVDPCSCRLSERENLLPTQQLYAWVCLWEIRPTDGGIPVEQNRTAATYDGGPRAYGEGRTAGTGKALIFYRHL